MSAFVVIYDRSNASGEPGVFNRVMDRLSHRGPDGSNVVSAGNITMGHWHFWTTPEEVGERQPLLLNGLPFRIVFDGRIDNREELFTKLSISSAEGKLLSDAGLILHAYARWGDNCFENFVGEFALVIFDERHNEIICARDQLGDRTLFYTYLGTRLVIASEPWAVVGAMNTMPEINENTVAHYFTFRIPEDGQTFFNNISELLSAHIMKISISNQRIWRYWQPDPHKLIRFKNDWEYAEHYLALWEESVHCRLRSPTRVGVFMSGGLDSTSVASTAARIMDPEPLIAISYVFNEFPDCDERIYINLVKDKSYLRSIQILCDDAWPFKDWEKQIYSPNQPGGNFYSMIKDRLYNEARSEGMRVVMTGGFGDHLHAGGTNWLIDLLLDGRLCDALHEIELQVSRGNYRKVFSLKMFRRILRRMINKIPGGNNIHRRKTAPEWLTPLSAGYILNTKNSFDSTKNNCAMMDLIIGYGNSRETFNSRRYDVETRYPFKDRRLIEFILNIPSYQLYHQAQDKYILREAMRGFLPETVRVRVNKTSLTPLFSYGVEREMKSLKTFYQNVNASWREFISVDWIEKNWSITSIKDGPEAVVPTLCLSYEAWHKSYMHE